MSKPTTDETVVLNLRKLHTLMLACCWDLSKHSKEGKQHAQELDSAADTVWQWIEQLETNETANERAN